MIQTLKRNITIGIAAIVFALALTVSAALPTSAIDNTVDVQNQTRHGSDVQLGGSTATHEVEGSDNVEHLIKTIINVFSAIVGSISVIMIIIGGFRYITSAGDSNSVGGAKNTILYAIVGLIIVAFAQIIVQFVLQRTTG